MTLPVILRPEAEADIRETFGTLEQCHAGLGAQFAARVREVLERIEAAPELHGVVWKDVRAVRLKQFRYVVYYVAFDAHIEVLAVIHGSRDSSTWQSRG